MAFDHNAGDRERGQAFQLSGLNEIQREIVGHHSAHRHTDKNVLHNQHENGESGKETARGRRPILCWLTHGVYFAATNVA